MARSSNLRIDCMFLVTKSCAANGGSEREWNISLLELNRKSLTHGSERNREEKTRKKKIHIRQLNEYNILTLPPKSRAQISKVSLHRKEMHYLLDRWRARAPSRQQQVPGNGSRTVTSCVCRKEPKNKIFVRFFFLDHCIKMTWVISRNESVHDYQRLWRRFM